jgi:lysyl-tRNA synthetase class 2
MALGADRFGDPRDTDCVVATAVKDGEARAVINFVPWGNDGMSLDLMVRDRDADPGLNELLIVKAIEASKGLGVARISLNFAVFRSALERGEKLGAGPITRMWRNVLVFFSRWYQIESLYKFNSKFRPEWVPRYVVFKNTRDIPRVGLAYAEAEGFIVPPGLPWRKKDEADQHAAECPARAEGEAECPEALHEAEAAEAAETTAAPASQDADDAEATPAVAEAAPTAAAPARAARGSRGPQGSQKPADADVQGTPPEGPDTGNS